MAILPFRAAKTDAKALRPRTILQGYSIKGMPRTVAKMRGCAGRGRAGGYCRPPIGIRSAALAEASTETATGQGGVA
jgi:hypothetical protein